MKVSVSLPEPDVSFLDEYAAQFDLASRSAAVQAAVVALREASLGDEYEAAWAEWAPEAPIWETVVGDGLDADAAR